MQSYLYNLIELYKNKEEKKEKPKQKENNPHKKTPKQTKQSTTDAILAEEENSLDFTRTASTYACSHSPVVKDVHQFVIDM